MVMVLAGVSLVCFAVGRVGFGVTIRLRLFRSYSYLLPAKFWTKTNKNGERDQKEIHEISSNNHATTEVCSTAANS